MPTPAAAAGNRHTPELPLGPRGRRTRAGLLRAARVVLERDGYVEARISDIAREAGVANGSFYTYFPDKWSIFTAMVEELSEEMLHPGAHARADAADPVAVIEASNRAYLESYRRNAALMALLEQVSSVDERFRALRRRRTEAFVERNAKAIARLQADGVADRELDPRLTSLALSSMVSRVAYTAFVLGDDTPLDDLVRTLTRVWANALRIPAART